MSELGNLIKKYRTKRNITQKALGGLVGLNQQHISKLEQGEKAINLIESWELLPKFSAILKIPIEKLFEAFLKDNKRKGSPYFSKEQETIDLFIPEEKNTRYFGNFLKTILKQTGLTAKNATKPLEIKAESTSQIIKYCKGKVIPKDMTIYKLVDFITQEIKANLIRTAIRYALIDRRQRLPNQDILLVNICEGSIDLVMERLQAELSNSQLAEEISTSETNITSLIYCTYQKKSYNHMKEIIRKLASYFNLNKRDFQKKFSEYLLAYKKREEIIKGSRSLG